MSDFQTVFKRYEKKYIVNCEQRKEILEAAGDYLTKDKYYKGTVCSIYYDTPTRQIIRNSIEKPIYKEKLRLRSYGVPERTDEVFLELKKKYDGIVYKRRAVMSLADAENFICGMREPQTQIERELAWELNFYKSVEPAVYISYDRTSFCGTDDTSFRLTFDTNVIYREEALSLSEGIWGDRLLDEGLYIMEVKSPLAIPLWLAHKLDELKIFPSSFSKYGTVYTMGLAANA